MTALVDRPVRRSPLERWLFEYTFPLEARFADLAFARPVWADLVSGLLAHGTTTAVYFGTVPAVVGGGIDSVASHASSERPVNRKE